MPAASAPFARRRTAVLLATLVFVLVLLGLGGAACRRSTPEAPPAAKAAPGVVEVLKGGRWLFTYVEPTGAFATTDKPDSVPAGARAIVRVFDPADPTKTDVPGRSTSRTSTSSRSPGRPRRARSPRGIRDGGPRAAAAGDSSALAAPRREGRRRSRAARSRRQVARGARARPFVTIYGNLVVRRLAARRGNI